MPTLDNRSQMMKYLGAEQKNPVWSWCAVNNEERKVYFSIWEDTRTTDGQGNIRYLIQGPSWGVDETTGKKAAARKDHDEKLALVFEEDYQPFGYVVVAKNTSSNPRVIEETKTGFIFQLELERNPDGYIYARATNRINLK